MLLFFKKKNNILGSKGGVGPTNAPGATDLTGSYGANNADILMLTN
jgi:hypothetical protein